MPDRILEDVYKDNLKVPRYTSYPTAPHFHEGITDSIYEGWLSDIAPNTATSLYLHIPFCKKLCWFCGCNTKIVNNYEPIEKYLDLLKKEISLLSNKIESPDIRHIHFGGGSPTIIKPGDFQELMDFIRESFSVSPDAEIAIEIDPRTVSEAKIAAYVKSGVNRVSVGIQDFNKEVQESINRIQPLGVVYDKIKILKEYGIQNINVDLIYGLPHQDIDALLKTIHLTLTLKPSRISLFGYAHVPWMKSHQKLIDENDLPSISQRLDMATQAKNMLVKEGYIHIGLDHFAKSDDSMVAAKNEGRLNRNFQGYTTDKADVLLGAGLSSIGSLPDGYIQNTSSPVQYSQLITSGKLPIAKGVKLTDEDIVRREIIFSLMCYLKVDLNAYKNDFSREIQMLQPFVANNTVTINDSIIKINEDSVSMLRVVASIFDSYISNNNKHSIAV